MTATTPAATDARLEKKRRRVVALQRWFLNPQTKPFVWLGLVPRHAMIETEGRRTGRRRRVVVGSHRDGDDLWVVAEHGRRAGWVRNADARPEVRVRVRARWHRVTAEILDHDDPQAWLASWGRPVHARLVRSAGTQLVTVRFRLQD